MQENQLQTNRAIRLTESAIMLAFATVLSLVKIVDLPYGGSITACSMLPIVLIAYRYGTPWGMFTAIAFSLLQLITGLNSVSYGTSVGAVLIIILFDYVIAFAVLGLGGIFRGKLGSQGAELAMGSLLACVLRYICHVISGVTVWRDISIPATDSLLYSLAYNATYMVPETIILMLGAVYVSGVLDFGSASITRAQPRAKKPDLAILFSGIAKLLLAAAAVWDIVEIAVPLQNPETGDFDITGIVNVNWVSVGIATAAGILLAAVFFLLARQVPADSQVRLTGLFSAIPFIAVAAAAVGAVWFSWGQLQEIAAEPDKALYNGLKVAVIAAAVISAVIVAVVRYRHKKAKAAQTAAG